MLYFAFKRRTTSSLLEMESETGVSAKAKLIRLQISNGHFASH